MIICECFSCICSNMELEIVVLFLELIVLGASVNGTNGTSNTITLNPTTNDIHATEDKTSDVNDLTMDSFNDSIAKGSHFIMFYDPT